MSHLPGTGEGADASQEGINLVCTNLVHFNLAAQSTAE
jgi:hypothetical protein